MSKVGLVTTEEGKFLAKIVADKIPVSGIWQTGLKLVLPAFINGLDDKFGDRVPEPWQTHIEELLTGLYVALQDKVLTEEELDTLLVLTTNIINAEIDIPLMNEDEEAAAYLFLLKSIASLIKAGLKK